MTPGSVCVAVLGSSSAALCPGVSPPGKLAGCSLKGSQEEWGAESLG